MRASLHQVAKVMRSSQIPKSINQQPFDYDPGHYERLCNLHGSKPSDSDLTDYALDMTYMEIQPDLFRYLMPVLLNAWRCDLFEGEAAGYRGFAEHFWPSMLKGNALPILTNSERTAVMHYMRDSILDRLDTEMVLGFSGMRSSPYGWVQALVSFGIIFPDIESLWIEWWRMKTPGHAVAAFQYASALLYENDKNPVFTPWTRNEGGGPPALWECCGHIYDNGWRNENLSFLKSTLTVEYVERNLGIALDLIQSNPAREIASRIIHELPNQRTLLALRIEELPNLLADVSRAEGFTI